MYQGSINNRWLIVAIVINAMSALMYLSLLFPTDIEPLWRSYQWFILFALNASALVFISYSILLAIKQQIVQRAHEQYIQVKKQAMIVIWRARYSLGQKKELLSEICNEHKTVNRSLLEQIRSQLKHHQLISDHELMLLIREVVSKIQTNQPCLRQYKVDHQH